MDSSAHSFIGGFEERIVPTVDGLAIYARDYAPLQPVTGLPVICLHGLTRNSRDFEAVAPRIAALGRRVIAPDMRGRGKSSNDPDPAHYAAMVYAQDVTALMDRLEVPRAVFVGTSMGGLITMVVSTLAPDRIAASVLNDVGPKLSVEGLNRIAAYVGRTPVLADWEAAAAAIKSIAATAYPDRVDDREFWLTFARRTFRALESGGVQADYDPHIALAFAEAADAPPADLTPLFQVLAAKPMLVVRGAISDLLSADTVNYMRSMKPDLHVAEAPNIGHAPQLDEPEVWDALVSFLARVP